MQGAGGTEGGVGRFVLGLVMMVAGGYLFLQSIKVTLGMGFDYQFFNFWGFAITNGMVLIPFLFGIGMIFYNGRSLVGWMRCCAWVDGSPRLRRAADANMSAGGVVCGWRISRMERERSANDSRSWLR